ncbi:MAG: sulfatase-like hydrolase/transferase [Planctomycetota bacterium]
MLHETRSVTSERRESCVRGSQTTSLRFYCLAMLWALALDPSAHETVAEELPNIVVILADDLGYGETGMMGNREIPTPAIDSLAASGVRCRAGYVTSSYCSPSRAGIFTGRYQSRFGYDLNPTGQRNLHPNAGLPLTEQTFVSRLQSVGYATGLLGKWHLGSEGPKLPGARGFDHFVGFTHEGHFFVPGPPWKRVQSFLRDKSLAPGERVREGNVIRSNHAPINEPPYDADNPLVKQSGAAPLQSWDTTTYLTDAITDEAVAFIRASSPGPFCAVVSYNAVHSPMQSLQTDLDSLKRIDDIQRRIFAGMLLALDRGVKRIREAIDDAGLTRRTLVVFLSDNGGPTKELTSSNAPLRDGKGSVYEGGLRVPMVWSMPGTLPSNHVEDRVILSLDIAATALELAGVGVPDNYDGRSVLSFFGDPTAGHLHPSVYWRMTNGKAAFRDGDWKLVRPKRGQRFELYHLALDVAESRDLASSETSHLSRLVSLWSAMDAQMAAPITLR